MSYPAAFRYINSTSDEAPYINSNATAYKGVQTFWCPPGIYVSNASADLLVLGQDNSDSSISEVSYQGAAENYGSIYNIQLNGPGIYEIIINSNGIEAAATSNGNSNQFGSSAENTIYTVINSTTYGNGRTFDLGSKDIYNCLSSNVGDYMYIAEATVSGTSVTDTSYAQSGNKPTVLYKVYDKYTYIPYVASYFCGVVNTNSCLIPQVTLYKYTIVNTFKDPQVILFQIVSAKSTPTNNTLKSAYIPATVSIKMISKLIPRA
jgi:hypothetical protein